MKLASIAKTPMIYSVMLPHGMIDQLFSILFISLVSKMKEKWLKNKMG